MSYFSNREAREAPDGYVPAKIDSDTGKVTGPQCCGQPMADDGGCGTGCCDDYRCGTCDYTVRVEWPD